jgi:hypothetical protein
MIGILNGELQLSEQDTGGQEAKMRETGRG